MKKVVLVFILFIILILALYANVLFGKRAKESVIETDESLKIEHIESETDSIDIQL